MNRPIYPRSAYRTELEPVSFLVILFLNSNNNVVKFFEQYICITNVDSKEALTSELMIPSWTCSPVTVLLSSAIIVNENDTL